MSLYFKIIYKIDGWYDTSIEMIKSTWTGNLSDVEDVEQVESPHTAGGIRNGADLGIPCDPDVLH